MDGMVNTGELSINVVKRNKPKMRTGLSQKGTVAGTGVCQFPVMDTQRYRPNREYLTRPCQPCGTW